MNQAVQKLTPLHPVAQRLQATLGDCHGWLAAQVYSRTEEELAAARQGVGLADASPNGKITVEGDQAEAFLQAHAGLSDLPVGAGVSVPAAWIYRLRRDLFFIHTAPQETETVCEQLTAAAQQADTLITVTDLTHGQAELAVVGPASRRLLSKLCGLDFHPEAFPNHAARQSSVAKTHQLIIRRDLGALPAFTVIGARSLAVYLWDTVTLAGREFSLAPLGWQTLEMLAED